MQKYVLRRIQTRSGPRSIQLLSMKESWLTGELCHFEPLESGKSYGIFKAWSSPNISQETAIQHLVVLPVLFHRSFFFANIAHI